MDRRRPERVHQRNSFKKYYIHMMDKLQDRRFMGMICWLMTNTIMSVFMIMDDCDRSIGDDRSFIDICD